MSGVRDEVLLPRNCLALAVFGLGSFIEGRLKDGMARQDLVEFMCSYLQAAACLEGRDCPDPLAQLSRTSVVSPALQDRLREVWPSWLPDGEKLRVLGLELQSDPCIEDHCEQTEQGSSLRPNV
jgi:hypothetical protein